MTTVLQLRFPAGRYHATPWDRAVNEAAIEWPPSVWRLLRAMFATWRGRLPDLDEATVTGVLAALSNPPSFHLPRHTEGHTRHYYPDIADGADKVFDPFACLDPAARVLVRWSHTLNDVERGVLSSLCDQLPYLGRADSLCEARLLSDEEVPDLPVAGWCDPGDVGDLSTPPARVLLPEEPLNLSALVGSTATMRRGGRTTPPGARWVTYRASLPEEPPALSPRRQGDETCVTAVRLRIDAPVLPTVHEAVTYGHVLRLAAMSRYGGSDRPPSATLSGKGDGVRLDGHRHAHYLVLDADGDRLLDTAVVWAPEGLRSQDVEALGRLRKLVFGAPGFRPVRIGVEAVGDVADVAPELVSTSAVWKSRTPFAPYRHQAKRELRAFLVDEVGRELRTRGLPELRSVEILPGSWLTHRRQRPGKGSDLRALGLCLELEQAVVGPLVLGALSHFGLGIFSPS